MTSIRRRRVQRRRWPLRTRFICTCGTVSHWFYTERLIEMGETEDGWIEWWIALHDRVQHNTA